MSNCQLGPRYKGQLTRMAEPIPPSGQSSSYSLSTLSSPSSTRSTRSGMLAHSCTRQHWLWVTVEPHISGTRHEEAVAREGGRYAPIRRVLGSGPLSLRTHRHRGRSRPLRSAVVVKQAPSVAV